jgi:hypothetical protein
MYRYGFSYASIGRPLTAPALGEGATHDQQPFLANALATAATL